MSFNQKLRKAVYGNARAAQTNPLLVLPAGVTGTTWHGTGFELAPQEAVELDPQTLPWELQEENPTGAHLGSMMSPTSPVDKKSISLGVILIAVVVVTIWFFGGF